jgi:hypothetical protein
LGLRAEDIPLPSIEWVRPATEMVLHLPLPLFSYPGAILGTRVIERSGTGEFIAADFRKHAADRHPRKDLRHLARKPQRLHSLLSTHDRNGSLMPLASRSALPAAFLQRVWQDRPAR